MLSDGSRLIYHLWIIPVKSDICRCNLHFIASYCYQGNLPSGPFGNFLIHHIPGFFSGHSPKGDVICINTCQNGIPFCGMHRLCHHGQAKE